jgi:hypothetical protein
MRSSLLLAAQSAPPPTATPTGDPSSTIRRVTVFVPGSTAATV